MRKNQRKKIDKKLRRLGRLLDMQGNDIAMAKLRVQTMLGALVITGIVALLSKMLCAQLDPSGLYYLVPQQTSQSFLSRFF
jgi:hypothetical protein